MAHEGHRRAIDLSPAHDVPGRERLVFLLLSAIILAGIFLRAALVPLVHDEAASLFWYVDRGEFLPYRSLWDANNHYLNSLAGIIGHKVLGLHLVAIRIFSVAAFGLYAHGVYRTGSAIRSGVVRWCTWSALLMCPFLLEMFSLFRGYGMALGFWLLAIDGLIRWVDRERMIHLAQVLVMLLLANASVPILLPISGIAISIIGVRLWLQREFWRRFELLLYLSLGILPMFAGALITWELRRRGLLYHGSTEGLLEVTVEPLLRLVTGVGGPPLAALLIFLGVGVITAAFSLRHQAAMLLAALLLGDLLLRVLAAWSFNVNYPEDRAGIHLVPPAILLFGMVVDGMANRTGHWRHLALPLLWLPIRTITNFNVDHTLLWPEQSVPAHWMHVIAEEQARYPERPLVVGAYHQLGLSIPYMARIAGVTIPLPEVHGFMRAEEDLRIVDHRFIENARTGYEELFNLDDRLFLLRREKIAERNIIAEYHPEDLSTGRETYRLWNFADDQLVPRHIGISGTLHCGEALAELYISVLHERDTIPRHEQGLSLRAIRPHWQGEGFHLIKWIDPAAGSPSLHLWAPDGTSCHVMDLRVVLYE